MFPGTDAGAQLLVIDFKIAIRDDAMMFPAPAMPVLTHLCAAPGINPIPGLIDPAVVSVVRVGVTHNQPQPGIRPREQSHSDRQNPRDRCPVCPQRDSG